MENKLSPLKVGAISELKVAYDLMEKGFDVFRALAQNACCDLIAVKNNLMIRIEVRTTIESDNGNIRQVVKPVDEGRSDCYAWVTENGITYEPEIESLLGKAILGEQQVINKQNQHKSIKLSKQSQKLYSFYLLCIAHLNEEYKDKLPVLKYWLTNDVKMFTKTQFDNALKQLLEVRFVEFNIEYCQNERLLHSEWFMKGKLKIQTIPDFTIAKEAEYYFNVLSQDKYFQYKLNN